MREDVPLGAKVHDSMPDLNSELKPVPFNCSNRFEIDSIVSLVT